MENIYWSWFWNKYKFNKGRGSLKKIGLYIYLIHIYTFLYGRVFSKQKVSSLGNAINPTFSKGESSEIISLTVPSTYIILIHEPKFFFLEQNLWTTSTLYYGMLRILSTMVWDGQKFTYIVLRKLLLMSDQNLFVWMFNVHRIWIAFERSGF